MSMLPFLHEVEHLEEEFTDITGIRFDSWLPLTLGLILLALSFVAMPSVVTRALSMSLFLAPLWLPFLLLRGSWNVRSILLRSEYIANQNNILLEVKPPRNLVKTPLAMEAFLSSIHLSPGESNWWARNFKGGVRPWWSLEIASFEGHVHFYIWTRANFRRIIEGQLYAQYPGVQVTEAVDYTRTISADPEEWEIWGCDFKQEAPDPLPIKTYVEYGLDEVQKEPEQVDPLANLIEFMSSIGKGEYLWLQFIIRVHKGEKYGKGGGTWKDAAKALVQQIREQTVGKVKYRDVFTGEMRETEGFPNPTKGQSEMIAAIERNVSKLAFDVGARCVYLAKPESFNAIMITHMISLFKPFNTEGWNKLNSTGWLKRFNDYPWEFRLEETKDHFRHALVQAFRRRQFFHDPFGHGVPFKEIMVMSTEEIATIYHIPSAGIQTPTIERIQSATSEAPPNLPV